MLESANIIEEEVNAKTAEALQSANTNDKEQRVKTVEVLKSVNINDKEVRVNSAIHTNANSVIDLMQVNILIIGTVKQKCIYRNTNVKAQEK